MADAASVTRMDARRERVARELQRARRLHHRKDATIAIGVLASLVVLAVVKSARSLQLTSNPLTTRIHTRDRGGICHQLANDGKVRWVK